MYSLNLCNIGTVVTIMFKNNTFVYYIHFYYLIYFYIGSKIIKRNIDKNTSRDHHEMHNSCIISNNY